jgi:hypothetical protein
VRRASISLGTLIALALLCALPGSASAAFVVGKTNKGGSCRMETIAERAGTSITYGGRVPSCSARFGIDTVEGRGLLWEDRDKVLVDVTPARSGGVPHEVTKTFNGKAGVPYRVSWQVTVVIHTRRNARRPRKPERWVDPGRYCRVYTTRHTGDTIGCRVDQDF